MTRKEIRSRTINQSNDCSCFNSRSNNQNGSVHNRRGKRNSNKKLRCLIEKDLKSIIKDLL